MFAFVEDEELEAERLRALRATLRGASGSGAAASLARLGDIGALAETSASPMLHATLQALVLWDLHVARRLDAWRATHGPSVGAWLDALGEIEALAAFAAIAHANPEWTYPRVSEAQPIELDVRGIGHPLLSPTVRVTNDLTVGPPGMVQLISGSNMSGKSTLLRAVGLNVVLALAGAPVCARSMRCPLVRLRTSIQVHDSLLEGVSYFMAELRRLKTIIDDATSGSEAGVRPALYLIDEILRGTNSEERAVAARMIVRRLLETNGIGIVTSHDLGMFADQALAPHIVHHHFRETIDAGSAGDRMRFDYHLHDGPATSRNALRLLALVGIGDARASD
jgi:DNA mismatch repair ATPase MutS